MFEEPRERADVLVLLSDFANSKLEIGNQIVIEVYKAIESLSSPLSTEISLKHQRKILLSSSGLWTMQ